MHFTRMGGYDGRGRPDHRPRRRLLPRGLERQALPRRARGALLGQHRLLVRRGDRAGGARADARAALLHELVVRAPARDRARGRGRVARARRPQPRLLLLRRLRGGRVGVEARAAVLHRAWREAAPGAVTPGHAQEPEPRWITTRSWPCGPPQRRYKAVARHIAYHGTTMGALSINGIPAIRAPFEPLVAEVRHVSNTNRYHRPADETEAEFTRSCSTSSSRRSSRWARRRSASCTWSRCRTRAAASRRPQGYWARRARDLRPLRHPALRRRGDHRRSAALGHWFGSERYDIRPDIVTIAKGLSSSYARDRRASSRRTA